MFTLNRIFQIFWILELLKCLGGLVVAPPWADPKLNPCASQPRGWQLLYWPPDGKCYKIFQMGYPCPNDMELSPSATGSGKQTELSAECKCPPRTAQSARDGRCYELFTSGPCEKAHYFAPDTEYITNSTTKRQWGVCKQATKCPNINEIFWPKDGRCYQRLTRGPCPKGQLLVMGPNKIAMCKCNNKYELQDYYYDDLSGCYQHFTRGPCKEKGHLFLPDRTCGCHTHLPHYHDETEQCFEIGTIGPCNVGENFQMDPANQKSLCMCKQGYIRYNSSDTCYRPYTQGPCQTGQFLVKTGVCAEQPCQRNHLYFPNENHCYRIGTRGPCAQNQVVTFDFKTRPSVDGISYNGLCGCEKGQDANCSSLKTNSCDSEPNMVLFQNKCYKLYTQGPCSKGAWIIPKRRRKEMIWEDDRKREGYCDCMPSYTKLIRTLNDKLIAECLPPSVLLADYLNKNFFAYNFANEAQP